MKKLLFLTIIFVSVFTYSASAQCGDDLLKTALKEMGETQYLKDFTINLMQQQKNTKTGYIKFSIFLNSRSEYKFNAVNGSANPEKVIMQLYDGDKLLASNFAGGKMYSAFQFKCNKPKVYNLVFSFKGGAEGCAKAVMSLFKQYAVGE